MDSNIQYPTMWTTGYVGGVKVSFTFPIRNEMEAYAQAKAITDKLLADGFTTEAPGLVAGEEREVIVTVMRRSKPSDETIIIDFYTEWGAGADEPFGTYKYLHIYMDKDKPEMIAEFLKFSGFKRIEDIPLYDAQASLKRTFGKKHPKETAVPTPFKIVKKQGAEKVGSDGKSYKPWEFVRYEVMNTPPPPTATAPASVTTAAEATVNGDEFEGKEVIITRAEKTGSVEGMGAKRGDKYDAWAKESVNGKSDIRVTMFPEDAAALLNAGYEFSESDNLNIPVTLTTRDRGLRRIDLNKIVLRKGTPTDNLNWALIWPKVRPLYTNGNHMTNSVNAMKHEGAFKNCADEAAAIAVIVAHKNGQAEGTPA